MKTVAFSECILGFSGTSQQTSFKLKVLYYCLYLYSTSHTSRTFFNYHNISRYYFLEFFLQKLIAKVE